MSKSSLKKPAVSLPAKTEKDSEALPIHWSDAVHECSVCISAEGTLNLQVGGGSDKGEFAYFDNLVQKKITYLNGYLENGDVILEIQGQKVAGFTQRDVVAWLNHCCKNGNSVRITVTRGGLLSKDLRLHLNTRFLKGTPDYELQNIVRDNLYLRTVPCTTRPPRDGEINGVDYTFLTPEEFLELERSGNLLESGIYEGNHYGTPKPPKESPVYSSRPNNIVNNNTNSSSISVIPGIHPSSEGKRRRNRSSVEAMTAKSGEPVDSSVFNPSGMNKAEPCQNPYDNKNDKNVKCVLSEEQDPLPENWEKAYTDKGEPYFIDHNTGTSQWLDPRLSKNKKPASECNDDELPYGWEKIDDPHYGTYYIDHVNKRTQYENPVLQAKKSLNDVEDHPKKSSSWKEEADNPSTERPNVVETEVISVPKPKEQNFVNCSSSLSQLSNLKNERHLGSLYGGGSSQDPHRPPYTFTRNPLELVGKMVRVNLVKSTRGFGFTIVGGDDGDIEGFLQIKAVIPNGPAWQDGKLKIGDVLVYINDTCVLGYSHQDVVSLFQSIPPGESVCLEVCQGYPLPFDPDDPNTKIVTTVAVSNSSETGTDMNSSYRSLGTVDSETQTRSAKSMPDLSSKSSNLSHRHNSTDLFSNNSEDQSSSVQDLSYLPNKPEYTSVEIVKGKAGFGFTIADSVYGQKVKKILDKMRCQHLREGDILVEINGRNIRGLSHTDVVQILKECTCGEAARITTQRGGLSRVSKIKSADDIDVRNSINNSSHLFAALPNRSDGYGSSVPVMYRSKTPTADLYSSCDKESVHVNRPKTPLVDTRYWPKSSTETSEPNDKRIYGQIANADSVSLSNRSDTFVSSRNADYSRHPHLSGQSVDNGVANRPAGFQNSWRPDTAPSLRTAYSASSDRTSVNPTWYTTLGKLRDTYWSENSKDVNKSGHLTPERMHNDMQHGTSHYGYSQIKLPPHVQANINHSYEDGIFPHGNQNHNWTKNSGNFCDGSSNDHYDWNAGATHKSNLGERLNTSRHGPHSQSPSHYAEVSNNGLVFGNDSYHQNFAPMPHPCANHSPNTSHYDSLTRQKHSTSFENEHPSPVSTMSKSDKMYTNNAFYNSQRQGLHPPFLGGMPNAIEMTVTLLRQENGFGFRIVGGTEEGSQVSIGHIVPGGAADLDGRLRTGDEITSVDNQIVLNTSHHRVVQLMGNAAVNGKVTLGIRRRMSSIDSAYHTRSTESIYPYDVTVSRRENEGFGFVIISSVSRAGSTIGRIIEGSPADRCSQLHVGDRILAVNNINILNMHHGDIVNLIKDSGYSVTLTVGPPQDDSSSTNSASQRDEEQSFETDDQYHAVELHRGTRGFGFSIRGGREFQNMPLYVLRIAENGPADQDGKLLVGDQIIEINGINTKSMTHAEAIELIKQGGSSVRLLVKRTNQIPSAIIDNPSPMSSGPVIYPPHHRSGVASNGHVVSRNSCDSASQDYYAWGFDHH